MRYVLIDADTLTQALPRPRDSYGKFPLSNPTLKQTYAIARFADPPCSVLFQLTRGCVWFE